MVVAGVLAFGAAAAGILVPATHTEPLADGRRLSPHNPLLPLLLAGPVAVGGWVGGKLAMAAMAGLLAAMLVWTAVRRLGVPVGTAALAAAVLACSPPLAVYGSQVYPELPAALAVLAAAAALTTTAVPGRAATLVVSVAVVALPWLGVKYAPVAAAIALVAWWRLAREGRWPPGSRPGCWPSRRWPPWSGAARPAGPPWPCR